VTMDVMKNSDEIDGEAEVQFLCLEMQATNCFCIARASGSRKLASNSKVAIFGT
jgi:hypothetical protein